MKSYEWVKRVRTAIRASSDNQVALALGVKRQTISDHKKGRLRSFDDETCQRIADILGIDVAEVIIDQHAEGAKSESLKKMWNDLGKMLSQSAALSPLILGVLNFEIFNRVNGLADLMNQVCILC